jgi:hypothetical protein
MATRFYLNNNNAGFPAPVSPAYAGDWEKTSDSARFALLTDKSARLDQATAEKSGAEAVSTSPYDVLLRQYVSPPLLSAVTITGTIKGQIGCRESNDAADFCRALVVKVVNKAGDTVRGTLLSHFPASLTSEFSTTSGGQNRAFPPADTALSDVEAQAGDRIVIELGYRSFNTSTTSRTGYLRFGVGQADDLPENETLSNPTAYNPWLEFSQDLEFEAQLGGLDALVTGDGLKLGGLGALAIGADMRLGGLDALAIGADMRLGALAVLVIGEPLLVSGGRRTFPLPNSKTVWQSQEGKRVFPLPGEQILS